MLISNIIYCVFRAGKNYYLEVFLEECIRVVKENNTPKYVTDDVKISTDGKNFDKANSDNFHIMLICLLL